MKNAENIDELIKEALSKEEAEFYEKLDEQSLPEMMTGLFHGKLKWWTVMTMVLSLLFFIAAVYCAVQFFGAIKLRQMIIWAAGFFNFMMMVSMLKLWSWMQMDKNALLREIKRLELQMSILSNKMGK